MSIDIFNFDYSQGATNWNIIISLTGKRDNNDNDVAYVKINQCGTHTECRTWQISDEQLVRHMGINMYLAFYHVVKNNKEPIQYYDFDSNVLSHWRDVDQEEIKRIEQAIRSYKTNGYLQLWREVKATLAAAIVIISSFDWIHYQHESCKLASHSGSLIDYLIYTLTFITKRDQGNYLFAQDVLNYVQRHRPLYSSNIKVKICLGVEYISSSSTMSQKCTVEETFSNDDNWWPYLLIALVLALVLFIMTWFGHWGAHRKGQRFVREYGEPLKLVR